MGMIGIELAQDDLIAMHNYMLATLTRTPADLVLLPVLAAARTSLDGAVAAVPLRLSIDDAWLFLEWLDQATRWHRSSSQRAQSTAANPFAAVADLLVEQLRIG